MSKGRDRIVYRREDKQWVEKRKDSERAGSVSNTQKEAASKAKEKFQSQGGGELIIKGHGCPVVISIDSTGAVIPTIFPQNDLRL